jgi:hypothetical protein
MEVNFVKTNVEAEKELSQLQAGFRRFVHDTLQIAIAKLGLKVEPPIVDVFVVPETYWLRLRDSAWANGATREEWMNARAVAVYLPVGFEDRLRATLELQRTDRSHNYDENVDYNAVVFLRRGTLVKGEEKTAVLEFYASLASSSFALAIAAEFGHYTVCTISDPFNDRNAAEAMGILTAPLTPEQFAQRYGPQD